MKKLDKIKQALKIGLKSFSKRVTDEIEKAIAEATAEAVARTKKTVAKAIESALAKAFAPQGSAEATATETEEATPAKKATETEEASADEEGDRSIKNKNGLSKDAIAKLRAKAGTIPAGATVGGQGSYKKNGKTTSVELTSKKQILDLLDQHEAGTITLLEL